MESSLVTVDVLFSTVPHMLSQCNVTLLAPSYLEGQHQAYMKNYSSAVTCNYATRTELKQHLIYAFIQNFKPTVADTYSRFIESGIFSFYQKIHYLINYYEWDRKFEVQKYNAGKEVSFAMSDWKVLPIFIGWASLLAFSSVVFAVEISVNFAVRRNFRNHAGAIMFRPKGSLARTVYDKMHKDQELEAMNKDIWYRVDRQRLESLSPDIWKTYVPFHLDSETKDFLVTCVSNSDNLCWQVWLSVATSMLSWFLSPTSINGLLGRGSMYVFSRHQFQELVDYRNGPLRGSLLDIGAGDGSTTEQMRPYFHKTYVTEMSKPMKRSLARNGFTVLDEVTWTDTGLEFDAISCLNVIDRCAEPIKLLNQIRSKLALGGIAIVAFVIPYKPYVEFQSVDHQPLERLPIAGSNFEQEVVNFVDKVLVPNGWQVLRWTRLPYLCDGDMNQAYYWLSDALFVIKPV